MMLEETPQNILDRLDTLLSGDGFRQSMRALFVKDLGHDWRAWVSVPGTPWALLPNVGVYNEEFRRIAHDAFAKIGRPSQQPPDSGPPLIMTPLERLIAGDADCEKYDAWDYHGTDSDPGKELGVSAADDLVYCLRKKAYPFFEAHTSLESIIRAGREMPSPALAMYEPIFLVKLGRRDDVLKYVARRMRSSPEMSAALKLQEYAKVLLETMPS
jgi:hypothetical protein